MFELPFDVEIVDAATDQFVCAKMVELTRELASLLDSTWWVINVGKTRRREEKDHAWRWVKVIGEQRKWEGDAYQAIAIQSLDGEIQGAASYWINRQSHLEPEKGAVELDRIAIAPRNRRNLCEPRGYKGVGFPLLFSVIRHSYLLGLQGRVRLESVDDPETHRFYQTNGFQVIMEDEGFLSFEIPKEAAIALLQEEGFPT